MPNDKYPVGWFVYYRDNVGDMIIATIVSAGAHFLTVRPGWYAAEPIVSLPLRPIEGGRPRYRIPISIIEQAQPNAPR
jgi:hypothetical protein